MHVFGLTGGIGSGKSAAAARLRARGVPVLDADAIARDVVRPGAPALAELTAAFGDDVLAADGTLDRKALAARAFASPEAKRRLDAITHPRIAAETARRTHALDAAGEPLACYEAALLVENGLADAFRPLVVVHVPEPVQIARASSRDGATEDEVRARIRAQLPLAEKVARADHAVDNSGPRDALVARVDEVLDAVCRSVGVDPARYPRPEPAAEGEGPAPDRRR